MIPIAQQCPGVYPDAGSSLVYKVRSASRPDVIHTVDFTAWSGHGECSCEHFLIRLAPALREGCKPGPGLECPHIKRARRYLALEAIQAIIDRRLVQAQKNSVKARYENENCPF